MKKIVLFLAVLCLASVFSVVFAAEDFIAIDFRTEEAAKELASISVSGVSEKQYVDGAYELTTSTSDPYITVNLKSKQRFEASDYPVIRVDYKVLNGAPTTGQIFFATTTDGFSMGSAGTYTQYNIDTTSMDWQSAVIDMELISSSQWADKVKTVRLDVTTSPDCTIAVRFAGFFKTEKEAFGFDYDKWAEENAPYTKGEAATTAPAETTTTPAAPADTTAPAAPAETTTTAPAPQTADPFTAVAAVMALSAGAALAIKKRR